MQESSAGIFWIKEEKWTAGSEIILFIQPIELYKCKHWLELNPQQNSLAHHKYIIHYHINCDNYVCLHACIMGEVYTIVYFFYNLKASVGIFIIFFKALCLLAS